MFSHCLSDVALIPPCDRAVLETEYSELCRWAVNKLRSSLLDVERLMMSGSTPDQQPDDVESSSTHRRLLQSHRVRNRSR